MSPLDGAAAGLESLAPGHAVRILGRGSRDGAVWIDLEEAGRWRARWAGRARYSLYVVLENASRRHVARLATRDMLLVVGPDELERALPELRAEAERRPSMTAGELADVLGPVHEEGSTAHVIDALSRRGIGPQLVVAGVTVRPGGVARLVRRLRDGEDLCLELAGAGQAATESFRLRGHVAVDGEHFVLLESGDGTALVAVSREGVVALDAERLRRAGRAWLATRGWSLNDALLALAPLPDQEDRTAPVTARNLPRHVQRHLIRARLRDFAAPLYAPALTPARVLVHRGGGDTLACLDRATGRELWTFSNGEALSPVAAAGGRVVVAWDGGLAALDEQEGVELWTHAHGTGMALACAAGDGLVVCDAEGRVTRLAAGGAVIAVARAGSTLSCPRAEGNYIVITGLDGTVRVLDGGLREVWSAALDAPLAFPAAAWGDVVAAVSTGGLLRAFALGDGAVRWEDRAAPKSRRHLAAGGGLVLVLDEAGRVTAHEARSGSVRWRESFAGAAALTAGAEMVHVHVEPGVVGRRLADGAHVGVISLPGTPVAPVAVDGEQVVALRDSGLYSRCPSWSAPA
jgi:outer membrane protein assembly factor BamB